MAGLLDMGFLSTPEAQAGLGLLAAGGGNMGNAIGAMLQQQQAAEERRLRREQQMLQQRLGNAQLANYQSEIDHRGLAAKKDERQQAMISSFLGGAQGGGGGQQAQGGGAPSGPAGILALAQQYGIPPEAVQADMVFNQGKGIAAMLEKHGSRDMQVHNGYLFDKNRAPQGFLPSMTTSQTGQTSMVTPTLNGPVVSAPQGALETYRAYQGAAADYKPIKIFNPATGREEYRSEGQVMGGAPTPPAPLRTPTQPGVMGAGYNGGDRDLANRESIQIIQAEMNRATRPEDKAALGREIAHLQQQSGMPQGTPMQPQSGAYAAGPSMMEQAQAKAAETRAVNTAAADVVRDTGQRADTKRAGQLTSGVDRAIDLLKQGPTSSLLGMGIDKALGAAGMSTKGADTAAQLETLSGWLTANVPRMEGPQSNADVENYRIQAAAVGNSAKPISQRLAAAEEVKRLQQKYADLNGAPAQSSAPQQAVPRVPMKGQVLQGYRFKGGNPADQANWEKM